MRIRIRNTDFVSAKNISSLSLIFSSYYSSLDLADKLLEDFSMTCVGTLQTNRKGLPDSFKNTKDRPEGDYQILHEVDGKKSIHSWITNTKSGKQGKEIEFNFLTKITSVLDPTLFGLDTDPHF
jgi:hypothetical protein